MTRKEIKVYIRLVECSEYRPKHEANIMFIHIDVVLRDMDIIV